MSVQRYTITVGSIKNGNLPCTNPQVIWGDNDCILQNCTIDGTTIKLSISDDELNCAKGQCIPLIIKCAECDVCDPVITQICFCDTDSDCGPCSICVNGICQPRCPDKKCDNGSCVDCIDDQDCPDGRVCKNGNCICPPGTFEKNGRCVECDESTILKNCEVCIDGKIRTKECNGACDPTTGDCVDCVSNSDCTGPNKCCFNGVCDCCPGFVYDATLRECVPAPDCIKNSDCKECEQCVGGECKPIVCPTGFICVGGDCVKDKCNGAPCATSADCPEGCGCDQGICRDCSTLPCNTCGTVEGCQCTDGVNCEDDGKGCNDSLVITESNCEFEGKLTRTEKCSCPLLSAGVYSEISAQGNVTVRIDLRQGIASTNEEHLQLPKLSDLGIVNALPTSGVAKVNVTATVLVGGVTQNVILPQVTSTLINTDEITVSAGNIQGQLVRYNVNVSIEGLDTPNNCKYVKKVIENKNISVSALVRTFEKLTSNSNRLPLFTWTRSKGNYTKTFRKVYVQGNGVYIDKLRGPKEQKINALSNGVEEGELWAGYDYTLEVDCTCSGPVTKKAIICDTQFEKDINFTVTNCGRSLNLITAFTPCPINRDITAYNTPTYTIKPDAQVFYELVVNGNILDTFKFVKVNSNWGKFRSTTDNSIFDGKTYNLQEQITSATLRQRIDGVNYCEKDNSIQPENIPDVEYSTVCIDGVRATVSIPSNNAAGVITEVKVGNTNISQQNGIFSVANLLVGVETTIQVTTLQGCTILLKVKPNCCSNRSITMLTTKNSDYTDQVDQSTVTCYDPVLHYVELIFNLVQNEAVSREKIFVKGPGQPTFVPITFGNITFNLNDQAVLRYPLDLSVILGQSTNATYTFKLVDGDCETEETFTFNKCNFLIKAIPAIVCSGQDSVIEITADANTVVIISTPNGNQTVQTNSNGIATINTQAAGTYSIVSVNGTPVSGVSTNLQVVPAPVLTNLTADSTGCTGSNVTVTLTGTPGAIVKLKQSATSPEVNVTINGLGTGTTTFVYNTAGTYTISATSVGLGNCTVPSNLTATVTVTQSPTLSLQNTTCNNANTEYTAFLVVNPPFATVTSDFGSVVTSGANVSITGIPAGQQVTVTATSGTCSTSITAVNQCECVEPPLGSLISAHEVCGTNTSLSVPLQYQLPVGTWLVKSYLGSFDNNFLLDTTAPITGVYTLSNLNNFGNPSNTLLPVFIEYFNSATPNCKRQLSVSPIVKSAPILTPLSLSNLCVGSVSVSGVNAQGQPPFTYSWEIKAPNNTITTQNTGIVNTVQFTPDQVGTYEFKVTVTYGGGCTTTLTFTRFSEVCCGLPETVGHTTTGSQLPLILNDPGIYNAQDIVNPGSNPLYVWFRMGFGPSRIIIKRSGTTIFDSLQIRRDRSSNMRSQNSYGGAIEPAFYQSPALSSIGIGQSVFNILFREYQPLNLDNGCTVDLLGTFNGVFSVPGIVAVRSSDYASGGFNGQSGIYIKIPQSVHLSQDIQVIVVPGHSQYQITNDLQKYCVCATSTFSGNVCPDGGSGSQSCGAPTCGYTIVPEFIYSCEPIIGALPNPNI